MGMIIGEDQYVGTLLDLLNVRFGPIGDPSNGPDGIVEMADIQRRFKIFQDKQSLRDSFAIMNLGGFWNTKLKNNWFGYLDSLKGLTSDQDGVNGDHRIVAALIEDLGSKPPSPVHFTVHDFGADKRVVVTKGKPLVYMNLDYIIVSLPMKAKSDKRSGSGAR